MFPSQNLLDDARLNGRGGGSVGLGEGGRFSEDDFLLGIW